jgi:hypothetical protein
VHLHLELWGKTFTVDLTPTDELLVEEEDDGDDVANDDEVAQGSDLAADHLLAETDESPRVTGFTRRQQQ